MKKTGAQIIVESLKAFGIEQVAGIPGGSILPLYDELNKSTINHVLVRQEQAAGFIAQGMARSTGKPAVCMATSGPGAMNLLTAIADARCDSVPIIAITGQVNTYLLGTDAFQEADTFGLSFPITKHSVMVKSAGELLTAIPEAFRIACEGRPGPVLIDVPRDIQLAECEVADDYFEKIVENAKNCKCKYVRSRDTSFKPLTRPFLGFVINPKSNLSWAKQTKLINKYKNEIKYFFIIKILSPTPEKLAFSSSLKTKKAYAHSEQSSSARSDIVF